MEMMNSLISKGQVSDVGEGVSEFQMHGNPHHPDLFNEGVTNHINIAPHKNSKYIVFSVERPDCADSSFPSSLSQCMPCIDCDMAEILFDDKLFVK